MEGCTYPPTHPCQAEGIAHRSARLASLLVRSPIDRLAPQARARCMPSSAPHLASHLASHRIASHRIASHRAVGLKRTSLCRQISLIVVPLVSFLGHSWLRHAPSTKAIDTPVHRTHRLQQPRTAAHGFVRSSGRRPLPSSWRPFGSCRHFARMAELGGSHGRRSSQWEVARLRPSRHGLARDGLPLCCSSEPLTAAAVFASLAYVSPPSRRG
jgi:hypothetical protein